MDHRFPIDILCEEAFISILESKCKLTRIFVSFNVVVVVKILFQKIGNLSSTSVIYFIYEF